MVYCVLSALTWLCEGTSICDWKPLTLNITSAMMLYPGGSVPGVTVAILMFEPLSWRASRLYTLSVISEVTVSPSGLYTGS